jgi:hypothetical protein
MAAQAAARVDDVGDEKMLDADTSAAILRWMDTGLVPKGVDPHDWDSWIAEGCGGSLRAQGVAMTTTMLGRWARSGASR